MFTSKGIVKYDKTDAYRLTLEVDQELSKYYFSLIPKYVRAKRPRWPAHVTIVRPEKEVPVNLEPWGKYAGERIEFLYDPYIHEGREYFWLNVFCKRLEFIRSELGLSIVSRYTLPPEGFTKCFHCTIANTKNI